MTSPHAGEDLRPPHDPSSLRDDATMDPGPTVRRHRPSVHIRLRCPDEHGPDAGYAPVRHDVISGWYFTVGSAMAGATASQPPSYATQKSRRASANLQ
jgi:hypothetical protein